MTPSDSRGDAEADAAIVRAFIASARRARWLAMLGDPDRRGEFLDRLNHCADLDPRVIVPLAGGADAEGELRARGAPEACYVLSAAESLDGRTMPLGLALRDTEVAGWGTILQCIPGRLGYFYDECGGRRFVLARAR